MIDRQQIQDQLARWQRELTTIKTDMDDPAQACENYGLDGDYCIVFKRNLGREASQAEIAIANLQKELCIYDLLVGTWAINVQDHLGNSIGQFNITSLDSGRTFFGTMALAETSQITPISGSYDESEQEIHLRRSFPEGIAQQYVGTVNSSAQPPTMQGEMTWLLPPYTVVELSLPSRWLAQKQP